MPKREKSISFLSAASVPCKNDERAFCQRSSRIQQEEKMCHYLELQLRVGGALAPSLYHVPESRVVQVVDVAVCLPPAEIVPYMSHCWIHDSTAIKSRQWRRQGDSREERRPEMRVIRRVCRYHCCHEFRSPSIEQRASRWEDETAILTIRSDPKSSRHQATEW